MPNVAVATLAQGKPRHETVLTDSVADTTTIASLLSGAPSSVIVIFSANSAKTRQSLQATLDKIEAHLRTLPWQPAAGT